MSKTIKRLLKTAFLFAFVFSCVTTAHAYNSKFLFDITSGMFSPWRYSSYATKYTTNESPVVNCTYTEGSTSTFKYTVRNSNNDDRVIPMTKTGTFSTTSFGNHTTVQNHQYKLGAARDGGSWNSSATTQGQWNIDSY